VFRAGYEDPGSGFGPGLVVVKPNNAR
jgi:hypothetical protein